MPDRIASFRAAWTSGTCLSSLLCIVLGGIFAIAGIVRLVPELRYQKAGIRVRATVVDKSIERASGSRSSTRYLVAYRFATEAGATMNGSDEVDVERWEELKEGDPFEATYLPALPQMNRGATSTEMPLAVGFTGIGSLVFVIGAVVFAVWIRSLSRRPSQISGGK